MRESKNRKGGLLKPPPPPDRIGLIRQYRSKFSANLWRFNGRRSPTYHLPLIRHKFAENSLRYCLIKQLNRERCSFLITAKVHTHTYQGYKIYLKHNAIDHYNVDCNNFECYVCKIKPLKINSSIIFVAPFLCYTLFCICI